MNNLNSSPVPSTGIVVNLGIAVIIGTILGFFNTGLESGISNGLMIGLTVAFFLQEGVLIQYLSREANVQFQEQLLKGEINTANRMMMLFLPPILLILLGFLLAFFSTNNIDFTMAVRICCVALIINFGIDPLYGLYERGILAVFGASVVYLLILQAGFSGSGEIPIIISPIVGIIPAISITSTIVIYLLLSTRWTYYRLFCFNQDDNLARVFVDTGLPLLLVLIPYIPKFISILGYIYLGN